MKLHKAKRFCNCVLQHRDDVQGFFYRRLQVSLSSSAAFGDLNVALIDTLFCTRNCVLLTLDHPSVWLTAGCSYVYGAPAGFLPPPRPRAIWDDRPRIQLSVSCHQLDSRVITSAGRYYDTDVVITAKEGLSLWEEGYHAAKFPKAENVLALAMPMAGFKKAFRLADVFPNLRCVSIRAFLRRAHHCLCGIWRCNRHACYSTTCIVLAVFDSCHAKASVGLALLPWLPALQHYLLNQHWLSSMKKVIYSAKRRLLDLS